MGEMRQREKTEKLLEKKSEQLFKRLFNFP